MKSSGYKFRNKNNKLPIAKDKFSKEISTKEKKYIVRLLYFTQMKNSTIYQ
ncbi:hypothetical protein [Mycoplasma sp. HU2014]|uniref:hypothetical protein n=1 Tax=Mycoplasma sp. HU2014 TaxID=1664275 RepID=UPI000A4B4EA3|nr:hypothetical protein [Mycoplasma sp. HU2014]